MPESQLYALIGDAEAGIVCGGHTHQPTDRRVGNVRVVNLGSVSNPITTDLRATYVIIDADQHGYRLTHQRVAYDHGVVVGRLRRSSHPQAEYIAEFKHGKQERYSAERPGAPTFDDDQPRTEL